MRMDSVGDRESIEFPILEARSGSSLIEVFSLSLEQGRGSCDIT